MYSSIVAFAWARLSKVSISSTSRFKEAKNLSATALSQQSPYLYGEAAKKKGKGKHVDESVYEVVGLPVPDPKAKPPRPARAEQRPGHHHGLHPAPKTIVELVSS